MQFYLKARSKTSYKSAFVAFVLTVVDWGIAVCSLKCIQRGNQNTFVMLMEAREPYSADVCLLSAQGIKSLSLTEVTFSTVI